MTLAQLAARAHFSIIKREAFPKLFKRPCSDKKKNWQAYRKQVWRITNKQPIETLPNHDKRSREGYHLDHIISTWKGWKNDIPEDVIGDIDNLRFITKKENYRKGIS